ncbi:glutathione S-transferase N-terminal domain-containing protein [Hyphobacterium sp. HN65]|uniref:Glutathione S-transferase N-terminal domain-containing protein n=1 Tax=Hyphobacterium lacteum TaxID=3116575 RepID=A0ABU7LLR8_9PROT|nr:glutathione S-transferase N-terminal domain-containing protein [Hyphobacterium sp. HN65]MEE2524837.1 glutathione S-transferase N-terminal domain-containing protein [Hyphobacterium sp. HN65]
MKLLMTETSPYARKCRVLIREQGLTERIEEVHAMPLDDPEELLDCNPLGKVPALIRADGTPLFDSPLICEYIDSLDDDRWIPKSGTARWRVLRFQALADGMLDLTVGRRVELTRPKEKQFDLWVQRQENGIRRSLDLLEAESDKFAGAFDLGAMSIAVALGYLDFRYPESQWREGRPVLAGFYEKWASRPSFESTQPPADA